MPSNKDGPVRLRKVPPTLPPEPIIPRTRAALQIQKRMASRELVSD